MACCACSVPAAPEPPEPECGDKEVRGLYKCTLDITGFVTLQVSEPGEECDCGPSWEECEDPCCYPATLLDEGDVDRIMAR